MTLVHRSSLSGSALCGATGRVRLSFSGANSTLTCPACAELSKPVNVRLIEQGYALSAGETEGRKRIVGPDGHDYGDLHASDAAALLKAVQS